MNTSISIAGVIVNQNTSHFTELLLQTIFLPDQRWDFDCSFTVLDNGSNDEHLPSLMSYLAEQHIPCIQTGFDTTIDASKHGASFESYIAKKSDCSHYLFLDADTWFTEPHTIHTLLSELTDAGPDVFANQARIYGYYAGRIIEGMDGISGASDATDGPGSPTTFEGRPYIKRVAHRCSPVCALVSNTPLFRNIVATIGLTPAFRLGVSTYTFYDTFSLMTHTMQAYNQRFIVSSTTVNHFTEIVHRPDLRAPKDHDCLYLLNHLRTGHGLTLDSFFESEWVKQQREGAHLT